MSNHVPTKSSLAPEAESTLSQKPKVTTKDLDTTDERTQEFNHEAILQEAGSTTTEERDGGALADKNEYPSSWKLVFIVFALGVSVLCMALDNTIIATAIPRITDHFHALDDVGWYGSAYLLTACGFQLIFGKLYTFYPLKWVFLIALGIFEIGSLVCGAAPTSTDLIIGRAVAGLGSAGIFSGAILIIAQSVPLHRRPVYTGIISAMYGIASVAGPLMGGAFTDILTWRWCFYINLPFGGFAAVFILLLLPEPKKDRPARLSLKEQILQMDVEGSLCFLPGVIALLLALQWGGSKYAWSDGRIIGLFIVFGVLLIAFVAIQVWKQEKATVPPRVFMNRSIWSCALYITCFGGSFFIILYYVPIWFQAIKGASAVKSGIMNIPLILSLVIASIVSGAAVTTIGHYVPFIYLSVILSTAGTGLLSTFTVDTAHPKWIGYLAMCGMGFGFGIQQPLIVAQTVLPAADVPIGTALLTFTQLFGGALFVSVAQNIFTNQLIKNLGGLPDVNPAAVLNTGATELQNSVPPELLRSVLVAYNGALTHTWYVAVALSSLSLIGVVFIEWKSVKGERIEMAAGA